MDQNTSLLHGVNSVADGIGIFGDNNNDHNVNTHKFTEKQWKRGDPQPRQLFCQSATNKLLWYAIQEKWFQF